MWQIDICWAHLSILHTQLVVCHICVCPSTHTNPYNDHKWCSHRSFQFIKIYGFTSDTFVKAVVIKWRQNTSDQAHPVRNTGPCKTTKTIQQNILLQWHITKSEVQPYSWLNIIIRSTTMFMMIKHNHQKYNHIHD